MKRPYNMPFRAEVADYQECANLVVERAKVNPTVLSVYLMGGEWVPGISDLDIVIVYKDGVEPMPVSGPWDLSDMAKKIFTHRYLTFSEKDFESIYFVHAPETTRLKHLYGKEFSFRDPRSELEGEAYKLFLCSVLNDILVNKVLGFFFYPKQIQSGSFDVRKIFLEIYSFKYTLSLYFLITGQELGHEFVKKITNLRRDWFSKSEEEALHELKDLLSECLDLIPEVVNGLDKWLQETGVNGGKGSFVSDRYKIDFIPNWDNSMFLDNLNKRSVELSLPVGSAPLSHRAYLLPASFLIFFQTYATKETEFGRRMSQALHAPELSGGLSSGHSQAVADMYDRALSKPFAFRPPITYGLDIGPVTALGRLRKMLTQTIILVKSVIYA